ncbi:MAG: serine O-acetyltransferase [Planctomycetota bacterium]|jgi:serine O-acetyltransferase
MPDHPCDPDPSAALETIRRSAQRRLRDEIIGDARTHHDDHDLLPDRSDVAATIEDVRRAIFPGLGASRGLDHAALDAHLAAALEALSTRLLRQVCGALRLDPSVDAEERQAEALVGAVIERLPDIRQALSLDVQAAFEGDPAARGYEEILLCYPGVEALMIHRVSHELHLLAVPLLPRMMAEQAHATTGIDIHPGATIGRSFFIDHGTGVVIGETTVIGDHCKLYQGVTLGATSLDIATNDGRREPPFKRHPTLADHVTVYAGTTILGGDTVIGEGCIVNGGLFVTESVPAGHIVRGPKCETTLRAK